MDELTNIIFKELEKTEYIIQNDVLSESARSQYMTEARLLKWVLSQIAEIEKPPAKTIPTDKSSYCSICSEGGDNTENCPERHGTGRTILPLQDKVTQESYRDAYHEVFKKPEDAEKISKRTLVLIAIRSFEKKHERGVMFVELEKAMKVYMNMERITVSKSLDSLEDMGLINQINAEMVLIDDSWAKVITTTEDSQEFIDDVIKRLEEE